MTRQTLGTVGNLTILEQLSGGHVKCLCTRGHRVKLRTDELLLTHLKPLCPKCRESVPIEGRSKRAFDKVFKTELNLDLTGQRFGKLTILGPSDSALAENRTVRYWWAKCDCGLEEETRETGLLNRKWWRCSVCEYPPAPGEDPLVNGMVEGCRIVRRLSNNRVQTVCSNGHTFSLAPEDVDKPMITTCPKCRDSESARNCALDALMASYRSGAETRGYSFDLTREEFESLVTSNCHYSGEPPSAIQKVRDGQLVYNGVDRKDNRLGYEIDNCVPCCRTMNVAKGTADYAEFVGLLKRMSARIQAGEVLNEKDSV